MRVLPLLCARSFRRVALTLLVVGTLVAGLMPAAPVSLDGAKLATTVTGDCNGNGTLDVKEVANANRDDDDDGVCNGADACVYEAGSCEMQAITVPMDPTDLSVPHRSYSGATHALKGIARYGGNQYFWDYGDGTAPMAWTAIANAYSLGVNHVYTGVVGTRFVATLSVRNSATPAVVATDTYTIELGEAPSGSPAGTPANAIQTDVRVAMALDQARWYLHTNMTRNTFLDGTPGFAKRYGTWSGLTSNHNPNCLAVDALEAGGSTPGGDYANDPYVETVQRSWNYIFSQSTSGPISNQVHGAVSDKPDTNGNGIGIRLMGPDNVQYQSGCLSALARTGTPNAVVTTGPGAITSNVFYGKTYLQVAQDAVDWLAFAQNDSGTYRGSWGYNANANFPGGDPGTFGMAPAALEAAAAFGATVPAFTRTEARFYASYARHTAKDANNGAYGYNGPNDVYLNASDTASNLLALLFSGTPSTDPLVSASVGFLARWWSSNNYGAGGAWNVNLGNSQAMYVTSQLLRAARLTTIQDWNYNANVPLGTPFDWYYNPPGQIQVGYARNLVTRQATNGMWSDTIGNDANTGVVGTALGIFILDDASPFGAAAVSAIARHTANGANGWNTTATVNEIVTTTGAVTSVACSDGTTTFTGSGAGSTWTVPITGEGVHAVTCTATGPSSSATSAVDTVKIDSIAPDVTGYPSRPAGPTGWYGASFSVQWAATDAGSGVETTSSSTYVDEGEAQQVYGSATDKAGNTGFGSAGPFQVDTTAPITTFEPLQGSPTNADFAGFQWIATDNLSGVAKTSITVDGEVTDYEGAPSGIFGVGGEGTHHVTFTSVDNAGNVEVSRTVTVVVDHSAPVVTANIAPSPRNGWYQATATVTVTCADLDLGDGTPGSGIAACGIAPTAAATASYDEGRWTVEVVGADVAGNETRQAYEVFVDQTAPAVVGIADRPANGDGWYDSPVAVNFTCTDPGLATGGDGSGVARCNDTAFIGDGTQAIVSGDGEDVAGNVGHSAGLPIKVDSTDPVVTWTANGAPFLAPWYSGPVTIAFTCADADGGSGISVCPEPVTFTGEGRNLSTTAQVADVAGNVVGVTVAGINIDRSQPEVRAQLSSEANSNGWHDSVTTIHWSCFDAPLADGTPGAGVVDCPADVLVGDGADQLFTATATDAAGNTSPEARTILSQDTVLPTLAGHTTSAPNGAGWYRADVTVAWDAADALSGVDPATRPAPSVLSAEGVGLTAAASVQDNAGNLTTATSPAVDIDRTAPATVAGLAGDGPGGWFNRLPVEVGLSSVDNLSGVTKVAYALDGVPGEVTGDAGIVTIAREGRHTLTFSATDAAGNVELVQTLVVNVDLDAPVISAAISPAPIGAWNTTPVTVTLTCADPDLGDHSPGSGISVCSAGSGAVSGNGANGAKTSALPVPTEGRHTVAGIAADVARNTSALSVDANIDARAPKITARTARPAGLTGWFTSPVDVQFDCDELPLADGSPGSGVASCPAAQTVAVDAAGQVVGGTTSDVAGNSASASATVNLDAAAPVVTFTVNGSSTIAPWYTGPVTVAFTCSDTGSGIADCPSPVTLAREASNQSVLGQARDVAGNTTDVDVAGINIDVTGPTVVAGLSSAANAAGWHRSPVTVAWTCTDPNLAGDGSNASGVATCPDPSTLGEGRDQVVTARSVDRAGNAGAPSSVTADVDLTPPTITGAATTTPGADGWYRDDVTVAWTVGDALSGVDPSTSPLPAVVSGEGSALAAAGSVADLAGNSASTTVAGIKIDRTAPVTEVTGAPADWTAEGVTLTLAATDALSGVAATRYRVDGAQPVTGTSVAIATDGRHRIELWSVDVAGNIEPSRTLEVLVDASSPRVTYTMTPGLNGNGWANAAVALEFTCVDPGSGLASCTDGNATTQVTAAADGSSSVAKMTVATEGAGQSRTVTARDRAGNTGSASATFGIDTTAPTVSGAAATPANASGWYRSPVSVGFTCADPVGANGSTGSGIATCADPVTVGEGAARSATGGAVDRAGNGSSATVTGLNVDLTAPALTFRASGQQGTGGWFTGPVTVHASATDALSGVVGTSVPTDVVLGADGASQQVSGTVLDRAGNQGTGAITGIKIDQTAPTVVVNRVVTPTAVSVSFVCTDATSGVVDCPAAYTITTSSPARTFTVADGAGNAKSVTVEGINVDATPPTITFTGNAGTYNVAATVAITCTAIDASGIRSSTCANVNAPAYTFGVGTETLTASATDNAGNSATRSTTFTVTVAYASLCQLHVRFIEGSTKFQALKPNQKAGGDAIGNALCQLAENLDRANVNARNGLLNAYRTLVGVNVAQGWLTPAQGTTLQTLAGSL